MLLVVASLCTSVTASAAQFKAFHDSLTAPGVARGLAVGPDGRVWVSEMQSGRVAALRPDGEVTEYDVAPGASLGTLAVGAGGRLWASTVGTTDVSAITTTGTVDHLALAALPATDPAVLAGPDGTTWVTSESVVSGPGFARIQPGLAVLSSFPTSGARFATHDSAVVGPDGLVWFSRDGGGLGKISATGAITSLDVSGWPAIDRLAVGSDGSVWASAGTFLGRIAKGGTRSEYTLPAAANAVTVDARGAAWLVTCGTGPSTCSLGRVTADGAASWSPLVAGPRTAGDLRVGSALAGPDGRIWVAVPGAGVLGATTTEIAPDARALAPEQVGPESATLVGQVNPQDASTTVAFRVAAPSGPERVSPARGVGAGGSTIDLRERMTGLQPGTAYRVRLQATSSDGTALSQEVAFRTPPADEGGTKKVRRRLVGRFRPFLLTVVAPRGGARLGTLVGLSRVDGLRVGWSVRLTCVSKCQRALSVSARAVRGRDRKLKLRFPRFRLPIVEGTVLRVVVSGKGRIGRYRDLRFRRRRVLDVAAPKNPSGCSVPDSGPLRPCL